MRGWAEALTPVEVGGGAGLKYFHLIAVAGVPCSLYQLPLHAAYDTLWHTIHNTNRGLSGWLEGAEQLKGACTEEWSVQPHNEGTPHISKENLLSAQDKRVSGGETTTMYITGITGGAMCLPARPIS